MLAAALAAATPAMGGGGEPKTYAGPIEQGGEISFRLSGAGRKVDQIAISEIVADCRGGTGKLVFKIHGDTPVVEGRKFGVRSEDGSGGKAFVQGRFSRNYKRAMGVVRVYGKFSFGPNGSARCNSGKQTFVAR